MKTKNQFPKEDGWITVRLTLTTKEALPDEELKIIAGFGSPDRYEFGYLEQNGARVKAVIRQKNAATMEAARRNVHCQSCKHWRVVDQTRPYGQCMNSASPFAGLETGASSECGCHSDLMPTAD